ncbi:MAG TPA: glucose-6-phosphate dehydrogenase assembly protein OpcA [Ktedonobacterales bacterium]|jgi:glucose-6-phosphate dehydrogenase assembly protein OpcA
MTEIDTTIGAVERGDYRAEHVALADVESALDGLWREANEQALASTGTPITRNTVLTLVACASDAEQAQAALDASDEVTAQHPARTIVLLPQPSDDPPRIETTATVHREGSGRAACYSEAIVVDAFGDAARHMPGVVLPLVVSGLPTFLWWLGEPPWGSVLLDALVDGADRLILDSCEFDDPDRGLGRAAELMRHKQSRVALSDFNWTRQAPWRELVAQFFDSANLRPYLTSIDRVTVEYAAGEEEDPVNTAQAYLLIGWLASRLGWSLPSGFRRGFGPTRQHTLHDQNGRLVLVEVDARFGMRQASWFAIEQRQRHQRALRPDGDPETSGAHAALGANGHGEASADGHRDAPTTPPTPPTSGDGFGPGIADAGEIGRGALMSVRLHAIADGRPGIFIVARDEDLAHATTLCQAEVGAQPPHTVHLPTLGESALLHSQLELMGHDTVYEEALDTAARLVGHDTRRPAY